jgi:hypothetical protein
MSGTIINEQLAICRQLQPSYYVLLLLLQRITKIPEAEASG